MSLFSAIKAVCPEVKELPEKISSIISGCLSVIPSKVLANFSYKRQQFLETTC